MTFGSIFRLLVIEVVFLRAVALGAEDRIWLEAKINGKPARFCFDSGSDSSCLTAGAAQKLGLKLIDASTNEIVNGPFVGETEQVILSLEGSKWKTSFLLVEVPPYAGPNFDGIIGWFTLSHNVMEIDARTKELTFLEKVPKRTAQWTRLPVITNYYTLDLSVAGGEGGDGVVCIDTGNPRGLFLPPSKWNRWKEAHPQALITLETAFSPMDGFFVYEEAWANEISIGPVVLTGVPIARSGPGNEKRFGPRYEGTLGLAALRRLDFTVDGNSGLAYLRARKTHPSNYDHNRLGAVFVPTGTRTNQAVARVIEGGPAHEAGVRNGDVLLRVDELAVTSWSDSWQSRFRLPAGTKLKLTLTRDEKPFNTTAILREIVNPGVERKAP